MTSSSDGLAEDLDRWLAPVDAAAALVAAVGSGHRRQPVHTVYVPASGYAADLPASYGQRARALLDAHVASAAELAAVTGISAAEAPAVYPRLLAKLESQPIEDLRIDFEDGYGHPPDDIEDADAVAAGAALAAARDQPDAPLLQGVRIKGFEPAVRRRGLRTLNLVLAEAVSAGGLPARFVVTLPKVSHAAEANAMVEICERLEQRYGLAAGALRFELQIELPAAVVGPDGSATVARLVHASAGRCEGLHYGTYDFSAAAGVPAGQQSLEHPLADHAKAVMQLAAAGTGVRVSDGSTNIVPVGDPEQVLAAWRLHARLVQRALRNGLYQGWDLHFGQLVTRFAASYAFLRAELFGAGATRLRAYTERAASGVMDEPATAQALAAGALRALDCGACDDSEVTAATGLSRSALEALVRREPLPAAVDPGAGRYRSEDAARA